VNERTKDLQETKRELEDMNQNLEHRVQRGIKTLAEAERMAAYGKLVANVAHEVRKPLFALRTAAYVIEETIIGPKEVRVQLDVVQQTTERLTSLMDDLLEFARPKPLQLEPTDIEELLKEAVTTYQVEHDSRFPKIDLVFSGVSEDGLKPLLPQIVADRSRMVQVLVNLIENAAKHAKGLSTVTFSAELNQNLPSRICIRVANDGAGIDPKNLPQIFDPFFTTGKGTGLGLAIVQQIVKGHDGTITVESQPGSGTIFTIDLPVKTSGATPRDA
jgi:signal transduction histidine kinase